MRRIFAAAVLLCVTATPALHVWCEAACSEHGTGAETSMPASCHHHEASPAPSIADRDDCGSHEASPAILARSSAPAAPLMMAVARIDLAVMPSDPAAYAVGATFSPPDTSPPAFTSPLRL